MKKNLRLLCLGLAAATFTCSFAQTDMTDKLQNADMEQGLKGWAFDGGNLVSKNTKNPAVQTGFYGMNQGVLEAWKSNGTGLADSYIMQRLSGLPNGTYVFGAYVGASKQYHRKDVCVKVDGVDKNGNKIVNHTLVNGAHQFEYWSNRDSVQGVQLFANDAVVRVATNNPDYNSMTCVKHGVYRDGHAMKFNVAVTLTEDSKRPGYLDAGLRYSGTNANYVVWDNVTLYYFGDMSEADALDAMAKIDVEMAIAATDTLVTKNVVMNADTLTVLMKVLDEAKAATVTAANLQEVTNKIFLTAGLARKSAADYETLKKNIESARVAAAGTWPGIIEGYVELLSEVIATAESAYNAHTMNRQDLTALRKELNWTAGDLKIDSLYSAQEELEEFIRVVDHSLGILNGYTQAQSDKLNALATELADTIIAYENDAYDMDTDEARAMADRTINPNNLYPYIARVYATIQEVKDNPITEGQVGMFSMTLPQSATAINGYKPLDGSVEDTNGYSYTSPLMEFGEKKELIRLTATKIASSAQIYFCIGSLEFFDEDGNEIELTAENFYSNADHNSVAGFADGQSYAGLVDDDPSTYFHSDWSGKITEPHYLEVTLPNGGYDAVSFKMVSRGSGQRHQFPAEIEVTTPKLLKNLNALNEQLTAAKNLNAYSVPEPGFYQKDFSNVLNAIAKAEAALEGDPSDAECKELAEELKQIIYNFQKDDEKSIYLPEDGKKYRVISAYTGYYDVQGVEKALTVHAADTTLWWENVCLDSLQQVFEFVPMVQDGEQVIVTEEGKNEDGTAWTQDYYCYTVKNVATGFFVDSAFVNNKIRLAEAATDTVMLKWLGRGQWNILIPNGFTDDGYRDFYSFHTGDHNSGNLSTAAGAYGGTYGVSSAIVSWGAGIDGASAWFIREMPELPLTVLAAEATDGDKFKSECIHFASANTITLTADKECAFTDLALYDLYGNAIAIDSLVVSGKTATITATEKNLVACAFEFTNSESVSSVKFDAVVYFAPTTLLQEAYDKAVAVAPEQGTEVGQYADLDEYTSALEAAEAMLDNGAEEESAYGTMIKRLEDAVKGLKVNMPEAGKYYFIYSAVEGFEKNKGYKMTLYTNSSELRWGNENYCDWARYWQFEPVSVEDMKEAGMDTTLCAYYIKNVANEMFVGDGPALASDKSSAIPYAVTVLNSGVEVALDGLGQSGKRLHANNHGGGSGTGSNVVYWSSGAGSASAWKIVEAQYDVTDIDFTEVENDAKVSAKGTFDLFGRRVVAPTAPGIYIIDGKKKYVK